MKLFDGVAKEYAERYWSVDAYQEQLNNWITSLSEGATVLDLGCGPGNYADYALKARPDIKWKGVDFSPAMIKIAKDSVPKGDFKVADVTDGALFQKKHQGVMISFVTPYLNDKSTKWMLRRSYNSLDPGGHIYLGTIVGEIDEIKAQKSSDGESSSLLTFYRKVSTYKKWLEDIGFEIIEVDTKTQDYGNELVDEAIFLARKNED